MKDLPCCRSIEMSSAVAVQAQQQSLSLLKLGVAFQPFNWHCTNKFIFEHSLKNSTLALFVLNSISMHSIYNSTQNERRDGKKLAGIEIRRAHSLARTYSPDNRILPFKKATLLLSL